MELTRTEFTLLEMFLRRPRRVLERSLHPRGGLGLRLPDDRQLPRGLRRLPAPQDRGRGRAPPDPHRPGRRVRAARSHEHPGHRARTRLVGAATSRRWHYRRSLASRVILLTTMAVGFAVALVALGAYVTVRMSLEHSLDNSLTQRARQAAAAPPNDVLQGQQIPSCALGAADVRLFLLTPDGHAVTMVKSDTAVPIGEPEFAVAPGHSHEQRPDGRRGRHRLPRGRRPVPHRRVRRSSSPSAWPPRRRAAPARRGDAAVRPRRRDRCRRGRLGRRPQRPAAGTPADPQRRGDRPHRATSSRSRSRATTRSRGWPRRSTRCWPRSPRPATASAGWSPTPGTSCAPRSPRCAPTSTCSLQADAAGGLDDGARRELLDDVRAQIEEMTTLIGDLVELARDEPLRIAVEQVDLAEVVDQAVARVRRRGTGLTFDVDTEPWWVRRRVRVPRAGGDQPARQRGEVEPARRHRLGSGSTTARSSSRTRAPASRPATATTSSTASTAPRSRARCPAPASGSRS